MPFDIETDNDTVQLTDGRELVADHIYINDVDLDELVAKVEHLQFSLNALHDKVDRILAVLSSQHKKQEWCPPIGLNFGRNY